MTLRGRRTWHWWRMSKQSHGFTLLEILVALLIFAILSVLMSDGLHRLIRVQQATERQATLLRDTQMAFVRLNRDLVAAVDRPITNAEGKRDLAFYGSADRFSFTRLGANEVSDEAPRSALERIAYAWHDNTVWRLTWPSLDQAEHTASEQRAWMKKVSEARFEYLDQRHQFHAGWPVQGQSNQALPRAVRVTLMVEGWGRVSQTFAIAAENIVLESHHEPTP